MIQSRPKPKLYQPPRIDTKPQTKEPIIKEELTKIVSAENIIPIDKDKDQNTNRIVKPSTALILNEMKAEVLEKMVCKEEFRSLLEKINGLDQYFLFF